MKRKRARSEAGTGSATSSFDVVLVLGSNPQSSPLPSCVVPLESRRKSLKGKTKKYEVLRQIQRQRMQESPQFKNLKDSVREIDVNYSSENDRMKIHPEDSVSDHLRSHKAWFSVKFFNKSDIDVVSGSLKFEKKQFRLRKTKSEEFVRKELDYRRKSLDAAQKVLDDISKSEFLAQEEKKKRRASFADDLGGEIAQVVELDQTLYSTKSTIQRLKIFLRALKNDPDSKSLFPGLVAGLLLIFLLVYYLMKMS
eukprot:snap_masked-scaffold_60-processed-gene-0.30-mRNA-1 protein AED:1.00 eAED:1.00 QI:0/-1/0/0/-1/1/1/0/252